MKRLIVTFVAALASVGLWMNAALAHTQLSSSIPADQSTVEAAPDEVSLTFSEPVRLTAVTVQTGTGSESLEVSAAEAAEEFTVALPRLAPGEYVIEWRALSADTHVVSGEIRFTVSS